MTLSDYFYSQPSLQWQLAKQLGVNHGVIRLPEDPEFDITNPSHIKSVADRFRAAGIRPLVVEPMPNCVHDHIKRADDKRDESIEKVLKMIPLLAENGWRDICTNFMAEIGWCRTTSTIKERGGALVPSDCLGITMCQANFVTMGEDIYDCIRHFGKQGKIFLVHFRDVVGNRACFHETFHDNGQTDMVKALRCYQEAGFDGSIRIDHVPTMAGEENGRPDYETMGRLYAVGYLRGLAEAIGYPLR